MLENFIKIFYFKRSKTCNGKIIGKKCSNLNYPGIIILIMIFHNKWNFLIDVLIPSAYPLCHLIIAFKINVLEENNWQKYLKILQFNSLVP